MKRNHLSARRTSRGSTTERKIEKIALVGGAAFVEILFSFRLYVTWGPIMGTALMFLNLLMIVALFQLVPLIQEYLEKDAAYDLYRLQVYSGYVSTSAAFTADTAKASWRLTKGFATSVKSLGYKIKSANTTAAIIR